MMSVYLIPTPQAERCKDVPQDFYAEAWESHNPDFEEHGAASWTTPETLDGLRAIGIEPVILAEAETLPVFHSLGSHIDTTGYEDALTAICKAASVGPDIKGVSYVGYNCEGKIADDLVFNRDRFFYYTRKEGRDFLWRVICDEDDAAWCLGLWEHDGNFEAWLKALGLEAESDERPGPSEA
jgi:hypothetical protein